MIQKRVASREQKAVRVVFFQCQKNFYRLNAIDAQSPRLDYAFVA